MIPHEKTFPHDGGEWQNPQWGENVDWARVADDIPRFFTDVNAYPCSEPCPQLVPSGIPSREEIRAKARALTRPLRFDHDATMTREWHCLCCDATIQISMTMTYIAHVRGGSGLADPRAHDWMSVDGDYDVFVCNRCSGADRFFRTQRMRDQMRRCRLRILADLPPHHDNHLLNLFDRKTRGLVVDSEWIISYRPGDGWEDRRRSAERFRFHWVRRDKHGQILYVFKYGRWQKKYDKVRDPILCDQFSHEGENDDTA